MRMNYIISNDPTVAETNAQLYNLNSALICKHISAHYTLYTLFWHFLHELNNL